MKITFTDVFLEQYNDFLKSDPQNANKIGELLNDIRISGLLHGIGKPEHLKHTKPPQYSRRINDKDRLVYIFAEDNADGVVVCLSCKGHYSDH